jgi:hypothetical protein
MEMCPTFEYAKSKIAYRKRPCNMLYAYQKHPELGFLYARIQTWFPFQIQVGMNGREWLARQMDREKLRYRQHQNCFTLIEDFPRAQQLMDEQLKTDWLALLDSFGSTLTNDIARQTLMAFPHVSRGAENNSLLRLAGVFHSLTKRKRHLIEMLHTLSVPRRNIVGKVLNAVLLIPWTSIVAR